MALPCKDHVFPRKRKARSLGSQNQTAKRPRILTHKRSQLSQEDAELHAQQILEDSAHYNKILPLLQGAHCSGPLKLQCWSLLCKVFCHLHIQNRMSRRSSAPENERLVTDWLWHRCEEFKEILLEALRTETEESEINKIIFILYEMMKAEVSASPDRTGSYWARESIFYRVLSSTLGNKSDLGLSHLMHSYIEPHNDLHPLLAQSLKAIIQDGGRFYQTNTVGRIISILSRPLWQMSKSLPGTKHQSLFFERSARSWILPADFTPVWSSLLRLELQTAHRRKILELVPTHIGPAMSRPEVLLDFLSQCCDQGGTEALLALSGLHYLIQEKGLDYPALYNRLYSLLDNNVLHKKQRSKILRLLRKYLSSTHLPAALVASFVKRLSRLCLYGPPAAIVVIVPLAYNLIQTHRVCSLMLHRTLPSTSRELPKILEHDPFDPKQIDPNLTQASESCLWEVESLSSHWHPNVATIARIMAEQFLKQSYNLEHFLDHSYQSFLTTEVNKLMTKEPAVEHQISRTVFSGNDVDKTTPRTWTFGKIRC